MRIRHPLGRGGASRSGSCFTLPLKSVGDPNATLVADDFENVIHRLKAEVGLGEISQLADQSWHKA